ncbi:acyl-CoA thioesterase [Miniimonas arenae]|uniref:Acyl-CoA thioesterase n=1 Tax=Miniimonas arenae TaxID=676201 RepID=A0A5C5BBZ0_9MICO|nr:MULTISPECIES: thioesterase family protein [Miniimonas]TNU74093.1 acyl-CoA thioesterase [Miniimonas arenae]
MRLRVQIPVRWADLDAYGHVNNAAAFTLLEEARIQAFWADAHTRSPWSTAVLTMGPGAATQTLVARQEIEYLRPVPYLRGGLTVQLWIGRLGGSSLELCYSVHDGDPELERTGPPLETPAYTIAATTLVMVTTATGAPTRLTRAQRAAWEPIVDEPLVFRHRR